MQPLAYWLMGAKSTITMDLNRYVKDELVVESLDYIAGNESDVREMFGPLLQESRLDELLGFHRSNNFQLDRFLELCRIEYRAPADAGETGLPAGSIDFHTSRSVFEHIPEDDLKRILTEGRRIVSANGLFVHRVDYSDHFAHSDSSISTINFLQYSDREWQKIAGNRYMYMNRLRHDEFVALFEEQGHRMLTIEPTVDDDAMALLQSGDFELDQRFESTPVDVLAITGAWFASQTGDLQ